MRYKKKPDVMTIVFAVLGVLILLFIAIPLVNTVVSSGFSTLWDTLGENQVQYSILMTIYAALLATLVGLVLGVPLAYLLARHYFPGKRFIEGIIDVPIVVPHSAAGIALLVVFGGNAFLGKIFGHMGIGFVDALPGVVIAMMFVSISFLINSAREGFESIDPRLENVARTLGASPLRTFFSITLPLARRSIFSGSLMMWARGISEFGAVYIIASYAPFFGQYPVAAPVLVAERFDMFGLSYATPVAVITMLISIAIFICLRTFVFKRS